MSLRFRLICLIAIVLAVSLAAEGTIVFFNASRSVGTEMNSALQVGRQFVESALARIPESPDQRRSLEELVAVFKGSRHLRVSLTGSGTATVEPSREGSHFGTGPAWFARLLGIAPLAAKVPVTIAGKDYGNIIIETDPSNEILEVWNDLGDTLFVLSLFFGLNILLIYFFIGCALRPVDHLAAALERIGRGNYKTRIASSAVPELARLQRSFNQMASKLADTEEERRRLNERLLTLQEEERSEIARDLHDEVSPFLFAVNADLATLSRLAAEGRSVEITMQLQPTMDAVSHMQRQIRALLGRLRPEVLEDFGLSAAIMSVVGFWRRRRPGTRIAVHLPPEEISFGTLIDVTVYRIVQESLSNAVRHGDPAEISVWVTMPAADMQGSDCITIKIANDSAGTDKTSGFGLGLRGMRERVQALGGQLVVAQELGLCFSVTATLPFPARSNPVRASSFAGD
jgi:two-component system, NarL family, sensor histidine kinase UhpB